MQIETGQIPSKSPPPPASPRQALEIPVQSFFKKMEIILATRAIVAEKAWQQSELDIGKPVFVLLFEARASKE
ncbi:MAG TPA: hypothetical protein VNS29_10940 [Burkholderiaceae bacterium]|nr:hypothetical protein [Burkholderiaceae bacterium]